MNRLLILFFLAPLLLLAASNQQRAPKPPQVEVLAVTAHRTTDGRIEIEGRIRNSSPRTIQKLVLLFHMKNSSDKVETTQRGALEDEQLESGDEAEFGWQMRDHVRAVTFQLDAVDRNGNHLILDKPGPYRIE